MKYVLAHTGSYSIPSSSLLGKKMQPIIMPEAIIPLEKRLLI